MKESFFLFNFNVQRTHSTTNLFKVLQSDQQRTGVTGFTGFKDGIYFK